MWFNVKILNMIKVLGYDVPNTMEELTIEQFEKVSAILNEEGKTSIEKYIEVFKLSGVPEDEMDEMTIPQFRDCVKEYNEAPKAELERVDNIELDGYNYVANWVEDSLLVPVKELKLIEKHIRSGQPYMSFIMAVLFKREDLTKAEHYTNAHLKLKQDKFKTLPAYYCLHYVGEIINKIK